MLENHLNAIEEVLCAQGKIASNAGHPNLIGNPKEWFIRNFLMDHLPETVKIGQGEIINSRTVLKESRNQSDIVLYRQDYPVISYSQDNNAFLYESVIATIEVKSTIDLKGFRKACKASINHKERKYIQDFDPNRPHRPVGNIESLITPPLTTYVVAYDGPEKISTAAKWLPRVSMELDATPDKLVDLIVILGKGTIWRLESFPPFEGMQNKWGAIGQQDKNLLILFLHLLFQISPIGNTVVEYAENVAFRNVTLF